MSKTAESEDSTLQESTVNLRDRFAVELRHLLIAAGFGVCFLYFNYIPLYCSDLWGHVSYGHWILDHRGLPTEDPFVPLAEGVPIVATAWLSQVIFAVIERAGGAEGLSNVFAITVLLTFVLYARVFWLQTRRAGLACFGAFLVWLVDFTRHAVIRPEIFGTLCFACLLWLIVRSDPEDSRASDSGSDDRIPWGLWFGTPVLFVIWANLHGSFVVGFAVLGSFFLGRSLQVVWQSRQLKTVVADKWVRRWLILTELAIAASLINPYGMDLLIHTMLFSSNPNLNDILEWFRLEMVSLQGLAVGLSCLLLTVLLRHSHERMKPAFVIILLIVLTAVCLRIRMLTWYAPIVVLTMMPHLADVLGRIAKSQPSAALAAFGSGLRGLSFRYTLFAGLVLWVCFAFSPSSRVVLGGKPRDVAHVYNSETPRGITEYLREHPPKGQIVNPQWWGDWMVLDGPPDLSVFMTTNAVHVVPSHVWRDYMAFATGQPGLERRLDRYRVTTMVVDISRQEQLAVQVRRMPGWTIDYEDKLGFVATQNSTTSAVPAEDVSSDDSSNAALSLNTSDTSVIEATE
jgi:hypothetical protein